MFCVLQNPQHRLQVEQGTEYLFGVRVPFMLSVAVSLVRRGIVITSVTAPGADRRTAP